MRQASLLEFLAPKRSRSYVDRTVEVTPNIVYRFYHCVHPTGAEVVFIALYGRDGRGEALLRVLLHYDSRAPYEVRA